MYGLFGGACSGTFHLGVKYSMVVIALSLAGFTQYLTAAGLPGDQLGSQALLESAQEQLVKDAPWLPMQMASLRVDFDKLEAEPTEDQVRQVLSILEPCSDMTVKEVMKNPDERREAAWLLYLDVYVKEGKTKAEQLFNKQRGSPPRGS